MNSEAETPEQHDATFLDTFEPREYPGQMDLWRLAVQIAEPPETTAGNIVIPDEYREDQEFASYVGQVRSMGPLCYTAVTRSQMDLKDAHGCQVGDWVQFGAHDGERLRTQDGTLWVILSDTQIMCVTEHPELFDCMSL